MHHANDPIADTVQHATAASGVLRLSVLAGTALLSFCPCRRRCCCSRSSGVRRRARVAVVVVGWHGAAGAVRVLLALWCVRRAATVIVCHAGCREEMRGCHHSRKDVGGLAKAGEGRRCGGLVCGCVVLGNVSKTTEAKLTAKRESSR